MKKSHAFKSAFVLLAAISLNVNSAIIYDNGGVSTGDNGNETTNWVQADDFNIASGGTVDGAGIYIGSFLGNLSNWDGTLEYFIFSSGGFTPGALLSSGNGVNVTTTDSGVAWCCSGNAWLFEFDFDSSFNAAAGQDYWLGIHLSADFISDDLFWISQDGTSGVRAESFVGTFDNWTTGSVERAFYLTTAVPIPATAWLLGSGFLVLVDIARRKKTA